MYHRYYHYHYYIFFFFLNFLHLVFTFYRLKCREFTQLYIVDMHSLRVDRNFGKTFDLANKQLQKHNRYGGEMGSKGIWGVLQLELELYKFVVWLC